MSERFSSKRKAVIGVGALFALLVSCGIGNAMGGDEPTKAAAPSTVTKMRTATETVTVTKTPTRMRAATTSEPTTTEETTPETTRKPRDVEPKRTTQRVVPLVPRTTEEAPSAYYANCSEARDAGAAPLYRGSPGYGSHLDRDDDGVACES
ncbi:excalibur calcium-binding domain-containing protein [Gordonia sp. (in: high G+C Gram-positive bacteria)]|uniref:excalibur calcium-binding domain-containing protein n=1 Tax=Gordonia sp. (in: high G+C Gram-positive bacteria) TaxID=84139 RepID=UPI00169CA6D2|nr:excalibur calcium-binding domain-containing protein [Gordonia sp. (in: high G+C Gram-positive bacteria)]NLG48078.1 excalibur calcium-binding domain-containing protein [Gordonia sp. (in: high G+C Gram-positive bacteria)]